MAKAASVAPFFISLFLFGCGGDTTILPAPSGIVRLPAAGNVEILLDFEGITGKKIVVTNGNDRTVGVSIVKDDDPSIIVFSDGWIGKRGVSARAGANFDFGWRLRVTTVIYKDLGASVESFLDSLGATFLDDLKDFWIEKRYEQVVLVSE